jgi:hypothetical protein
MYKILNRIMNSIWDIRIFLGLVPKESPCIIHVTNQDSPHIEKYEHLFCTPRNIHFCNDWHKDNMQNP